MSMPDEESRALEAARTIRRVRELAGSVITAHEGRVGTHSPSCYQWHAGCLAHRVEGIISDHYGNGDTNE